MKKPVELNIYGIKCDSCDFKDMFVKVEEYPQWLNKPCPDCGENLLTDADYDNVKALMEIAKFANSILPPSKSKDSKDERATISVEMDGTGNMNFKLKENIYYEKLH